MDRAASDIDALAAALTEVAASHSGEHAEPDLLLDYLQGRISEESEASLQDHLISCRSCTERLLELESISSPQHAASRETPDFELFAAWKRLKDRVASGALGRLTRLRSLQAVAAVLLLATVGLVGCVARLSWLASEPRLNPTILYLGESTRGDGGPNIKLASGDEWVLLIVTPEELQTLPDYQVEVRAADGDQVWKGAGLQRSDNGTIRLGLPARLLPAGEYQVELHGLDSGQWLALGTHRFIISYGED
jgi:hypothetical protein